MIPLKEKYFESSKALSPLLYYINRVIVFFLVYVEAVQQNRIWLHAHNKHFFLATETFEAEFTTSFIAVTLMPFKFIY